MSGVADMGVMPDFPDVRLELAQYLYSTEYGKSHDLVAGRSLADDIRLCNDAEGSSEDTWNVIYGEMCAIATTIATEFWDCSPENSLIGTTRNSGIRSHE